MDGWKIQVIPVEANNRAIINNEFTDKSRWKDVTITRLLPNEENYNINLDCYMAVTLYRKSSLICRVTCLNCFTTSLHHSATVKLTSAEDKHQHTHTHSAIWENTKMK